MVNSDQEQLIEMINDLQNTVIGLEEEISKLKQMNAYQAKIIHNHRRTNTYLTHLSDTYVEEYGYSDDSCQNKVKIIPVRDSKGIVHYMYK